ncbi:MAG: hypothetical protein WEA61_05915 [Anaerolineales bacterium]
MMLVTACGSAEPTPTLPPTETPSPVASPTASPTETPQATSTPTVTSTPTITLTPTETVSPTPESLAIEAVEGNANCRWGPGTAYIEYASLLEGERAAVEGRDYSSTWAYIQLPDYDRHCWVALSAVEINGNIRDVGVVVPNLYPSEEVPVPGGVSAERNGNNVTISWSAVADAPEVGYLLEVVQCINGYLINASYATENTSITFQDGTNCSGNSQGTLRSKNKLGYSFPVTIPWP